MKLSAIPNRSPQQRLEALQLANEIRTYRARLKVALKAGQADIVTILRNPPPQVETMRVYDLLLALPKIGRTKANKTMQRARTSPSKTVGGLSDRQREEILRLIAPRFASDALLERRAA